MNNDGTVLKSLNSISSKITKLCDRVEAVKSRAPERIAVIAYFLCRSLMAFVHEPWFDEALAWLIARDSSISEILFTAPHYEGHPSLWHLVLMPFAKLGAPYELSLNFVSLIFSGIAMALFIYKAPFKRIIRIILPFTYFMFYQYSVVNRPYCMMMLAFVLMAITYNKRNEHPGHFVISLWFLCVTGAYGLVIAGGICIVWLIEMFLDGKKISKTKNSDNGEYRGNIRIFFEDSLVKNGKIFWLTSLLLYAIFIIYRIKPADDAFAVLNTEENITSSFLVRLLYIMFGMLSDLFITNTYSSGNTITASDLSLIDIIPSVIIGIGVFFILVYLAKCKKMLLLLLIPYSMVVVTMTWLYMSRHHMGILLLFLLFFAWIYIEKREQENINSIDLNNEINTTKDRNSLKISLTVIGLAISILIPLYWNISSCVVDVIFNYSLGHDEYVYLYDNGYLDSTVLAEWEKMPVGESKVEPITFSVVITEMLPYMKQDVFLNSPSKAGYNYSLIHKPPTSEMTETLKQNIDNIEPPMVIIGNPEYSQIYSTVFDFTDYEWVYEVSGGIIWKGVPEIVPERIYVRKSR